ncbi:DUF5926 family protein [Phaeacidiphilus oryzae]|jgi:hypothetical protein|uniref:DUF5926 family protein n=1 Tax=Phaeacidiphilus oryzae TaxID=348818 RepID=UPI000A046E83|nr:DUF5926 family protein [Phaeacidiphilus oryzae]
MAAAQRKNTAKGAGKRAGRRGAAGAPQNRRPLSSDEPVPVVGAREPCPCGSGRRYKACHGREAAHVAQELVTRPFAGLPDEADWVALRELVPAATAPLRLSERGRELAVGEVPSVTLTTVLPLALAAIRRQDGSVLVGLQTQSGSGDVSRDAGDALAQALAAEPGASVAVRRPQPDSPRLQDLLDTSAGLDLTLHQDFGYWLESPDGAESPSGEVAASLERANAAIIPTERLGSGLSAAYWCRAAEKNHLRWVMTHDEERLLDALARLSAAGEAGLGEGTRLVGSFRAHGLTVPVWDLPAETTAAEVEKPAVAFGERLTAALAETGPLTAAERKSRAGLVNRQLTIG